MYHILLTNNTHHRLEFWHTYICWPTSTVFYFCTFLRVGGVDLKDYLKVCSEENHCNRKIHNPQQHAYQIS